MTVPQNKKSNPSDVRKVRFVGALCFLSLMACGAGAFFMISCSREEATLSASYFKPTATPIPGTPTFSPTPTPWLYEDFNGDFPPGASKSNGNCYAEGANGPPADAWFVDEYFNNAEGSISMGLATAHAYPAGETDSEGCTLTFTSNAGQTGWGISSIGASGCGGGIAVPANCTSSSSTLTYWLYPVTPDGQNLTFESGILIYGGAYAYYLNSGSPVSFSAPSGQWYEVTMPLSTGNFTAGNLPANSTSWNVQFVFTEPLAPASGTFPYLVDVYCADYVFTP